MAVENDGTATAVQASQVQATTIADSILNLEQANPGCGNYTAMGATTTGGSLDLGALSTWEPSGGAIGTANGDINVSDSGTNGGEVVFYGTGADSNFVQLVSNTISVLPNTTYTASAYQNMLNAETSGGWYASLRVFTQSGVFIGQTATGPGTSELTSFTFTTGASVTGITIDVTPSGMVVPAGETTSFSQIQLTVDGTLSGVSSQFMPCQVGVPAGEYYQAASDTQQPPASLSSCGSEPQVTTLNLEQASPSPWFCVDYSGQVLWGYAESSWVVPTADASVCPGSSGESSAVPVASLLQRTVVLKSQVLNQPIRSYAISRTAAPSVGPLPAGALSTGNLKSVMVTGVPQGDFAELAMNLWTGGTGGASQTQVLVTGSPNSSGQIFFPAIPADATGVEYWITSTPSLQNPPSVASGTQITSLSNTVTCEAG